MLEHMKFEYLASGGVAFGSGAATLFGVIPVVLGCLASIAAVAWIGVQFYWARQDRKKQGK